MSTTASAAIDGGVDSQETRPGTRERILAVAQREISERGIDGVSIRTVAKLAGVDPRLVRHYFGSRERLLLYAVQIGEDPYALARHVSEGSPRTLGRRTAKALLEHWDNPRLSMPYRARLSAALTNEEIGELMLDEFVTGFFGTLAKLHSPNKPELRAALAGAEVVGLALCRYLVAD